MLKIQEIRELIKLIDQSSIEEFKFEQDGSKITMRKQMPRSQQYLMGEAKPGAPTVSVNHEETTQKSVQKMEAVTNDPELPLSEDRNENVFAITSPMVGTFYESPSPESPAYVKVGDKVSSDAVVCIVEAMKLMNEIEAEVNGEIIEILAESGQLVEYGQELFLVKKG